jgi:hypothetical protein
MSRLMTVSFGESKPAVFGHDETAWQMNRRSELQPEERTASIRRDLRWLACARRLAALDGS